MNIFEFDDYRLFLTNLIQSYPRKGRGLNTRLAEHLSVHPVVISQVMGGKREFTEEQALAIAEFFGMNEAAMEAFILLVNWKRASSPSLRSRYEKKWRALRAQSLNLKKQVIEHQELNEADKGQFYSNWYYAAVSLLSSIPRYQTVDAIAEYLGFTRARTIEIVTWLRDRGLCNEADGRITMGVVSTYVDSQSPFVNSHRRNWRFKAIEKFPKPGEQDLFYSGPYSLSEKDYEWLRKELVKLISAASTRVGNSPPEKLACLNLDFFEF